jgi:hypothetical protein
VDERETNESKRHAPTLNISQPTKSRQKTNEPSSPPSSLDTPVRSSFIASTAFSAFVSQRASASFHSSR